MLDHTRDGLAAEPKLIGHSLASRAPIPRNALSLAQRTAVVAFGSVREKVASPCRLRGRATTVGAGWGGAEVSKELQGRPGRHPGVGFAQSEFILDNLVNQNYPAASSCPRKGTLRDRHGTLARVAMDAVASGVNKRRTRR